MVETPESARVVKKKKTAPGRFRKTPMSHCGAQMGLHSLWPYESLTFMFNIFEIIPKVLIIFASNQEKSVLDFFAEHHTGSHRKSRNVKSSVGGATLRCFISLFWSVEIAKAR